MASLKEVKTRISSVASTQQLTKAMKMVAAAKLRKSQEKVVQMRSFSQKLSELVSAVLSDVEEEENWYNPSKEEGHILFVVISSDRGLCGSFNTNVIKTVLQYTDTHFKDQHDSDQIKILPIGRKAYEGFKKRAYPVNEDYRDLLQQISFDKTCEFGNFLIDAFEKKEYAQIKIVYNEFKNVATRIIRIENFLPLKLEKPQNSLRSTTDYIYQPNHKDIVDGLIPKSLKARLYRALLESSAAENGARMTAMDQASDNASEMLKELRLEYNHTRQAAITKEILEIVGGAEALKRT